MAEKDRKNQKQDTSRRAEDRPATFTGERRGTGESSSTNIGRGGDAIVQDDVVYGRPQMGRDRVAGDRAREQEGRIVERSETDASPAHAKEEEGSGGPESEQD